MESVPQRGSVWLSVASQLNLDLGRATRYRVVVLTLSPLSHNSRDQMTNEKCPMTNDQ